jgi:HAD superfamily hydrolase (TIGR01509 family)
MELNHIEGIIFDAEGVVVDTEILWDKSQDILLGRRGLIYDRDYLKPRMAGQTLLEGARLMVEYYGLQESASTIAKERKELINVLFEQEIAFMPGFISFYNWLKNTKFKTGIATAMEKILMVKVEKKLKLQDLFGDHIYFIEDVGNKSKPAPDVFLLAAEKMEIKASNCLVIEDAPHGIEAANRAGMISIGLVTTFSKELLNKAAFIAGDFQEIREFLSNGITNIK